MKKFAVEIKWGILFSIACLVWMIIENSVGLHDKFIAKQPLYTNLFAFVAMAIFALALRDKKAIVFKGNMTWKQGFMTGVVLSIVISIISPLVQYISYTYISPVFFANMITYSVTHNVQTQTQAEAYFNLNSFMTKGLYDSLSMGVLTSAIVAYFLKTKTK